MVVKETADREEVNNDLEGGRTVKSGNKMGDGLVLKVFINLKGCHVDDRRSILL